MSIKKSAGYDSNSAASRIYQYIREKIDRNMPDFEMLDICEGALKSTPIDTSSVTPCPPMNPDCKLASAAIIGLAVLQLLAQPDLDYCRRIRNSLDVANFAGAIAKHAIHVYDADTDGVLSAKELDTALIYASSLYYYYSVNFHIAPGSSEMRELTEHLKRESGS